MIVSAICILGFKAVFAAPRETSSSRHDKWDDYDSYSGSRDYTHGSQTNLSSYSDTASTRNTLLISPAGNVFIVFTDMNWNHLSNATVGVNFIS